MLCVEPLFDCESSIFQDTPDEAEIDGAAVWVRNDDPQAVSTHPFVLAPPRKRAFEAEHSELAYQLTPGHGS